MKVIKNRLLIWGLLPFILIFAAQVIPRFWQDSVTSDEPLKISCGYSYWNQGDVLSNVHQAPFSSALEALPLLLLDLKRNPVPTFNESDRAFAFLYLTNINHLQTIMVITRSVALLLGLGIGILLLASARQESRIFLFSALTLWAFEPNLLAFSGIAISDIHVTFFTFAAVLSFRKSLESPGLKLPFFTGLLAGLAVFSKYSALFLGPLFLLSELLELRAKGLGGKNSDYSRMMVRWLFMALAFGTVLFLVFLPGTIHLPGHHLPFYYFMNSMGEIIAHGEHPYPSYFMGILSDQRYWCYFPVAFLLKTTLPFSFLVLTGIVLALTRRIQIPAWQWLPPLVILFSLLPVIDIGIRYLLPAFPFLILMAASAAAWLWEYQSPAIRNGFKILVSCLLLWHVATVLAHFPHHLSYFNDAVATDKKIYWLGDSNLDFDQDVKRLAETGQKRGWKKVKLAYSGSNNPSIYGLNWQRWTAKDLQGPQPGNVYAINAGFLQVAPAFFPEIWPIVHSWVEKVPYTGKVADTWFYFEIPGQIEKDDSPLLPSVPVLKAF